MIAYAIGSLGAGWMMDRVGVRLGFAISLVVWSLAAIAQELDPYDPEKVHEYVIERAECKRMLDRLAGRGHEVMTGICLAWDGEPVVDVETTRVYFAPMTGPEIEGYVASGEPMDKAGGYAIQGLASKFIERIEGDYFNVVGLPVARVYRHLRSLWREQESSLS